MLQSPSRQQGRHVVTSIPGLAVTLILSILAGGCAEQSGDDATRQASKAPTSKELFVTYCGACHGEDGTGNGPLAAELKVPPPNLRLIKQANDGTFPSRKIQHAIDGRAMPRAHGLPDMPVWGRQWISEGLEEPQIRARALSIASYISSIQE